MRIPKTFITLTLGLTFICTAAFAAEKVRGFEKADTRDKFEQLVVLVKQEMGSEGRYRFVSPSDRIVVERRFDDMRVVFSKNDSIIAMDLDQKTALYNAQEKINAILTQNDTNRIVCQNKKIIGSNIPRRTCMTYGELKEEEMAAQEYMWEHSKVHCQHEHASPQTFSRPYTGMPCV